MARNPLLDAPGGNRLVADVGAQGVTPADAWQYNAQAYQAYADRQREEGIRLGLIDPQTGWPTRAGLIEAARSYGDALLGSTTAPGGRTFYHFTDQTFPTFGGRSRGAVYLAPTEAGAQAGGLAGMRQRLTGADEFASVGPMRADQVQGGKTLRVNVPDDLRIYGDNPPATMTNAERDAILTEAEAFKHPDPKVEAAGKSLLRKQVTGRSDTMSVADEKWIEGLFDRYADPDTQMTAAERDRYGAISRKLGTFPHLNDVEFETPVTQEALRALGYHGARVADEGGLSLGVLDPSRLQIQQ